MKRLKKVTFLQNGIEKTVIGKLSETGHNFIRISNQFGDIKIHTRNIIRNISIEPKHRKPRVNISTRDEIATEPVKMVPEANLSMFVKFFKNQIHSIE